MLGTKLLKNTNTKPYTIYRMISLSVSYLEWTLTPISRSWHFSTLNISETTQDRESINRKSYALYRMVTLRDLWPRFQGHGITEGEYLKNSACYGQSFYRTILGVYASRGFVSISWSSCWISCAHVLRIRTPLSVLLHGTALCTDGLAHQLVVICYIVRSGIH